MDRDTVFITVSTAPLLSRIGQAGHYNNILLTTSIPRKCFQFHENFFRGDGHIHKLKRSKLNDGGVFFSPKTRESRRGYSERTVRSRAGSNDRRGQSRDVLQTVLVRNRSAGVGISEADSQARVPSMGSAHRRRRVA